MIVPLRRYAGRSAWRHGGVGATSSRNDVVTPRVGSGRMASGTGARMSGDRNPTARALTALELIQASPGITADRIAERARRLGAGGPALRRAPCARRTSRSCRCAARTAATGWAAGCDRRRSCSRRAEALALVMAVLDGHHDLDDPTEPVGTAIGKIVRSLPEAVAAPVRAVRDVAAPAPDRAAARPDPARRRRSCRRAPPTDACGWRTGPRAATRGTTRGRPVGGRRPARPLVPAVPVGRVRRPSRVPRGPGGARRPAGRDVRAARGPRPRRRARRAPGRPGWEFAVDVVLQAPAHRAQHWLPRGLGRLEPIDGSSCRLVGTTSNPYWYAERLAPVPVDYRVVGGPELLATVRALGRRMLAATERPRCPSPLADPRERSAGHRPPVRAAGPRRRARRPPRGAGPRGRCAGRTPRSGRRAAAAGSRGCRRRRRRARAGPGRRSPAPPPSRSRDRSTAPSHAA